MRDEQYAQIMAMMPEVEEAMARAMESRKNISAAAIHNTMFPKQEPIVINGVIWRMGI